MKFLYTVLLLLLTTSLAVAQKKSYWQQQVNYNIRVALDDSAKTLDAMEEFVYSNHSPDTLHFIWMHLWPNAYKNDRTAFSEQMLLNGTTDFYFTDDEKKGYINRIDFKVNGEQAKTTDHPQHQDIVKLWLPQPLNPGDSIRVSTPFHVKLPYNFSRGGYVGHSFQITQWYPKPAVYDPQGWHEMPYLDQGEFYSEWGNYDVTITLKDSFKVAATGIPISRKKENGLQTIQYHLDNIHDFAWFADKQFNVSTDTLSLNGRNITLQTYSYDTVHQRNLKMLEYIKRTITSRSSWIGDYPYPVVSVVESRKNGGGGMEYPTITLIDGGENGKDLDMLIEHEVGHNWFYGLLGSNERLHPWMDEGINTYYDKRYEDSFYRKEFSPLNISFIENRIPEHINDLLLQSLYRTHTDQPIETSSSQFNSNNYNFIAYYKTSLWMKSLEEKMGTARFDSGMKSYFNTWKYAHPQPEHFKETMKSFSNIDLHEHFLLLNKKGDMVKPTPKKIKLTFLYNLNDLEHTHYISFAPMAGFNQYDKLMLGAAIHNFSIPGNRLEFFAVPLYASGTHQLNGIGSIKLNFYPGTKGDKLSFGLNYAKFTGNRYRLDNVDSYNLPFQKMVPTIKYTWAGKDALSKTKRYLQWKTFLLHETALRFYSDSTSIPISKEQNNTTIHQLRYVIENKRKLYPYQLEAKAEKGKSFIRLGLTADYYFNYPTGGGLEIRAFVGKFIYTIAKNYLSEYLNERYQLNMTGADGNEDYTYSDYFIGRNDFEGAFSQQIMRRDGFFKVRSSMLSSKIGKSDNWLAAVNLCTTLPRSINPLALLPVKIPVKVFADLGTYAEAWAIHPPTEKLLYDAGFQLSLIKNTVHIYFPVISSKSFREYSRSTITEKRFLKNIAFSIDINRISIQQLMPELPF